MSWEDANWDESSEDEESEDEAVKQLRLEALAEKNKPKKKSLAQRKAEEEAKRKAEQAVIDEEVCTRSCLSFAQKYWNLWW